MSTGNIDFAQLRKEGIQYLERMIGDEWSDFNAHDPGITILEQVCYALTDLNYRANFDLPDLLAESGENWAREFYRPSEVLTTQPVTLTDLRKLAMDVEGVKNAWVEQVHEPGPPMYYHLGKKELSLQDESPTSEAVHLKGLYKVWIEKSDLSGIDGSIVRQEVTRRLQAYRPLCEDFDDIRVLKDTPIQVTARIEIGLVEDAETLLLEIYERLANYISPCTPFCNLEQMLSAGKRMDEIFDGPMLQHGFIDTVALEQIHRRESFHSSDLIQEIMSVAGVRAVRHISISNGGKQQEWELKLPVSDSIPMAPKFDHVRSNILLQREQIEVDVNKAAVNSTYEQQLTNTSQFNLLPEGERDILPPVGQRRNVGRYHSILHQFPLNYGVGAAGLPAMASVQRRVQAKQFKAYLMFYDQLLANLFAQLAHASDLFGFDGHGARSYFANMIDDAELGLDAIRRQDSEEHQKLLQEMTDTSIQQQKTGERRNRFLNHLLARFAEHFTDYSLLLSSTSPKDGMTPVDRLIRDKEAFLRQYPRISTARGGGFNYLEPFGNDNLSGLEQRIRLKLGLLADDDENFYMVEHILLRAMEGDKQQAVPFLAESCSKDPYSLQLSFILPDWPVRFKPEGGFRQLIEQTIRDETPAHLTIHIHWLDKDTMTNFEMVYRDWMEKLRHYRTGV